MKQFSKASIIFILLVLMGCEGKKEREYKNIIAIIGEEKELAAEIMPTVVPSSSAGIYGLQESKNGLPLTFGIANTPKSTLYFTYGPTADIHPPTEDPQFLYKNQVITIYSETVFKFLLVTPKGKKSESSFTYTFDLVPPSSPHVSFSSESGEYNDQLQITITPPAADTVELYYSFQGELLNTLLNRHDLEQKICGETLNTLLDHHDLNQKTCEGLITPYSDFLKLACPAEGLLEGQKGSFQAIAMDEGGNLSPPTDLYTFVCDRILPTMTLEASPNGHYTADQIVKVSADKDVTFYITTIAGVDPLSGAEQIQRVFKKKGEILEIVLDQPRSYLAVRAKDKAGNLSRETVSREYIIEKEAFVTLAMTPARNILEEDEKVTSILFKKNVGPIKVYASMDRPLNCDSPSESDLVSFESGSNESRNYLSTALEGTAGQSHELKYCYLFYEESEDSFKPLYQSPLLSKTVSFVGLTQINTSQNTFLVNDVVQYIPKISFSVSSPAGIQKISYSLDSDTTESPIAIPATATTFSHQMDFPSSAPSSTNELKLKIQSFSGKIVETLFNKMNIPKRAYKTIAGGFDILGEVNGVVTDTSGNLYASTHSFVSDHKIIKIDTAGNISTIAGGAEGYCGDGGPAIEACLDYPYGLAFDAAGNLYIADLGNSRIRKVDTAGIISTVAGIGDPEVFGFSGDGGPATEAELAYPSDVALDAAGNLYIADYYNHRIRKVDPSGMISTVVGSGEPQTEGSFGGDGGPAIEAQLSFPFSLAFDQAGNLYFSDSWNNRIRKVDANGIISTFTEMNVPHGLVFDSSGNLYVSEKYESKIKKIDSEGQISTIAGSIPGDDLSPNICGDGGPATEACLSAPYDVAIDQIGTVYIADTANRRVRKVELSGIISSIAGTGQIGFSGDGGKALDAVFNVPTAMTVDPQGNMYSVDSENQRIRKINRDGNIFTIAGTGQRGFNGDGKPATQASLNFPQSIVADQRGNLYIADTYNYRVRKIDPSGIISTIAGTGQDDYGRDGIAATSSPIRHIYGLALDPNGTNLYLADPNSNIIRKVDLITGIISTVAGKVKQSGLSGDGGLATEALLKFPSNVAMDRSENLYIVDQGNNRIQKVNRDGIIFTVALGSDLAITLQKIILDQVGNLFMISNSNTIKRISAGDGTISTIEDVNNKINKPAGFAIHQSSLFISQPHGILENHISPP